jgi:hypothetical protein
MAASSWRTLLACLVLYGGQAHAFGPAGHRIAGLLAEPHVCAVAVGQMRALTDGDDLGEIGQWADHIRSTPQWRHTGPWHYMNVDEENRVRGALAAEAALRAYVSPPEGDVLVAIERFARELGDPAGSHEARAAALRFLVHFVVDVHQPLHVGRATDRGGNLVDVRHLGETVNLHRFWDSGVLELARRSPRAEARRLAARIDAAAARSTPPDPRTWAVESLAVRPAVYSFAAAPAELSHDYVAAAQAIVDERLLRAAERLAATLNHLLCR